MAQRRSRVDGGKRRTFPRFERGMARAKLACMKTKRLRAAWVVAVGAGAIVGACAGNGNSGGCPTDEPVLPAKCALDPSILCSYSRGPCGPETGYRCDIRAGTWTEDYFGNPPAAVCPPTPPTGACTCFPTNMQCSYPNGVCNGTPQNEIAICSNGQWTVAIATCNPPAPGPDGGVDASTTDAARD
jgi:hypothetical protein